MFARGSVQDRPQHEEGGKRGNHPARDKIRHKPGDIRLEGGEPGTANPTAGYRRGNAEGTEPSKKRADGDEHNGPEHPFRKTTAHMKRRASLASQADSREN